MGSPPPNKKKPGLVQQFGLVPLIAAGGGAGLLLLLLLVGVLWWAISDDPDAVASEDDPTQVAQTTGPVPRPVPAVTPAPTTVPSVTPVPSANSGGHGSVNVEDIRSHEDLIKATLESGLALCEALETATDESAAQAARDRLEAQVAVRAQLEQKFAELGEPSGDAEKALKQKYETQAEELAKRLERAMKRVASNQKVAAILMPTIKRMGLPVAGSATTSSTAKSPPSGRKPPFALAQVSGPTNLLDKIDPQKHSLKTKWNFYQQKYLYSSKDDPSHCFLPVEPPAEYEVELRVQNRTAPNGLGIGLLASGYPFMIEIDGDGGKKTGLHKIDGRWGFDNETTHAGRLLAANARGRNTIIATVHKGGVRLSVDGKQIFDWKGDHSRLSLPKYWSPGYQCLWIGASSATYQFEKIEIRPLAAEPLPKPEFVLTSEQLQQEFASDPSGVKNKYGGKQVQLTGPLHGNPGRQGHAFTFSMGVDTTMHAYGAIASSDTSQVKDLMPSQELTVIGTFEIPERGVFKSQPFLQNCRVAAVSPDQAVEMPAEELAREFAADRQSALKKWYRKPVRLKGTVAGLDDGFQYVLLKGSGNVKIRSQLDYFEYETKKKSGELKPGREVVLQGLVSTSVREEFVQVAHGHLVAGFKRGSSDTPHPANTGVAKISKPPIERKILTSTTNLLPLIDPREHALQGEWRMDGGVLVSPKAKPAYLRLPVVAPNAYDINAKVERVDGTGGIAFGIVCGEEHYVLAEFDAKDRRFQGLHLIDGKSVDNNETTKKGRVLTNDYKNTVRIRVTTGGVMMGVEQFTVTEWGGDFSRLSLPPNWNLTDDVGLFIGTWDTTYRIHELEFIPKGRVTKRPATRPAGSGTKAAGQADVVIDAETLGKEFSGDTAAFGNKYGGKVIDVQGPVKLFDEGSGSIVMGSINFHFQTDHEAPWRVVSRGQRITLRTKYSPSFGFGKATIVAKEPFALTALTSEELARQYASNAAAVKKRYDDKLLLLTGQIVAKQANDLGAVSLFLRSVGSVKVKASFTAFSQKETKPLRIGQYVQLKGEFNAALNLDNGEVGVYFCCLAADPRDTPFPTGGTAIGSEPSASADKAEKAAASLLKLAKDFQSQGDTKKAREWYKKVIERYPKTQAAQEAKKALGP